MYGKHFSSMYTCSMFGAGTDVFAVWGYVIAHAVEGQVELNPKLLAAVLGSTEEEMREAIRYLLSPDNDSRSKQEEGRRLVKIGEYAYSVPNHVSYRAIRCEDDRRAYNREKQREHRERKSQPIVNDKSNVNSLVIDSQSLSAHTEAEAEAEAETHTTHPPRKPKTAHSRKLTLDELPKSARDLAEQLKAHILDNNPDAKITESQLTSWTREADRLFRLDQRDQQDASELLDWAQHDSFWLTNILSMSKFREQYDQLHVKAIANLQKHPRSQLPHPTEPEPLQTSPKSFGVQPTCSHCGTPREWHAVNGAGHSLALDRFQCKEFVAHSSLP